MGTPLIETEALHIERFASHPGDFAYLSGSIVEGFGNPRSDIDVFVVLAEGEGLPAPAVEVHDDYYVDFEIYGSQAFGATLRRVAAAQGSDHHTVWALPKKDLDLCYRTAIGEPVLNPAEFFKAQQAISKETVAKVYEEWAFLKSEVAEHLAKLYLEADLPELTLLHARQSALYACEAFLAARGEAYVSLKWRFQKLARLFGEDSREYKQAWSMTLSNCLEATEYLNMVEAYNRKLNPLSASAHVVTDILRPTLHEGVSTYSVGSQVYLLTESRSVMPLTSMGAWIVRQFSRNCTIEQLVEDLCGYASISTTTGRKIVLRLIAKLEQDGSVQW